MSSSRPFTGVVEALPAEEVRRIDDALEAWFNGETKPAVTPDPILPEEWNGHWIYLIASPADLIKLGISRDPDARFASLQSGHHDTLRLLATVSGFPEDESALHSLLVAYRVRGEWFRIGPWLDTFMEGARAGENAGMILKRLRSKQP